MGEKNGTKATEVGSKGHTGNIIGTRSHIRQRREEGGHNEWRSHNGMQKRKREVTHSPSRVWVNKVCPVSGRLYLSESR